jgi:DNA-binding winged helix-turn-helix (wHTH) protein/tetratricopeptide (TPR) repeat protein
LHQRLQTLPHLIDLASESAFRLGPLAVTPATLQVEHGSAAHTLEPRVMQVLVALAQANGAVVSRDELVDRCWGGRIVGENAVHRVISRIRQLAAEQGDGQLAVETIPRVGYRLLVAEAAPGANAPAEPGPHPVAPGSAPIGDRPAPAPPAAPRTTRRALIAAAGLGAAALAGGLAWRASRQPTPEQARARDLIAGAQGLLRHGDPGTDRQAMAFLEAATRSDPDNALPWGMLAMIQQDMLGYASDAELSGIANRTHEAAARALALDPANAEAQVAAAIVPPNFRRWARNEAKLRPIVEQHPDHPVPVHQLGWLLLDVGRMREATACLRRALALDPLRARYHAHYILGLVATGQMTEAERVLAEAQRLWPGRTQFAGMRFNLHLHSGQVDAAEALLLAPHPSPLDGWGKNPPQVERRLATVRALRSRSAPDIARIAAQLEADAQRNLTSSAAMMLLCALGQTEAALRVAWRRLFGDPALGIAAPHPLRALHVPIMHAPMLRPLRAHPRFPELTRLAGLDAYWRTTRTRPDADT